MDRTAVRFTEYPLSAFQNGQGWAAKELPADAPAAVAGSGAGDRMALGAPVVPGKEGWSPREGDGGCSSESI